MFSNIFKARIVITEPARAQIILSSAPIIFILRWYLLMPAQLWTSVAQKASEKYIQTANGTISVATYNYHCQCIQYHAPKIRKSFRICENSEEFYIITGYSRSGATAYASYRLCLRRRIQDGQQWRRPTLELNNIRAANRFVHSAITISVIQWWEMSYSVIFPKKTQDGRHLDEPNRTRIVGYCPTKSALILVVISSWYEPLSGAKI